MSKFYVGQRVRIVRACEWDGVGPLPIPAGTEGVITKLAFAPKGTPTTCGGRLIESVDCWIQTPIRLCSAPFWRIEPIQPERNQTIAWSQCVWKPEHMRAEA